jgi:surface antigen
LSRRAQAFGKSDAWSSRPKCPKVLLVLIAVLPLSACASGFDLGKAEVDKTFYTSAVSTDSGSSMDPTQLSDVATIRNAVSAADVEQMNGQALSWANSDTGSRGSITGLVEYRDKGALCRRFQATRESFEGVSMFSGDACLAGAGAWRMRAFEAL